MKTNIKRITYNKEPDPNGRWYTWVERCDRCGALIRDENTITTTIPDTGEADFCSSCIQYLLHHNISYNEARQMFKKDV